MPRSFPPPVSFRDIEAIRSHAWVGNAYSDGPALSAIHEFVVDASRPMAQRAEALRLMAREGMGLTGPDAGDGVSDADLVAEYLRDTT